ncbi:MAG: NAD(P)/FAD-dependent oxidoreductase [Butyricicoccus sp.]|nr:NAD(P)/FAD-dependent oxidoreductase [Butyricicoccus sp.]
MKRYAVIGFGCAGYSAAKTLRECCPDSVIDVYSNTTDAPANPMLTTYYVSGRISRKEVFPLGEKEEIVDSLNIHLYEETPVVHLKARSRTVVLSNGEERSYDDIVLATGSHPLVPPVPGMPEKGVYVMRTVYDADRLLDAVSGGISSALVIGASWVGIKVVEALYAHGVPVTLADMAPRIFPTASLPGTAEAIHRRLEEKGIRLLFGQGIASFREEDDGIVTVFSDGTEVKSGIVALCLGLRPTVGYLDRSELTIGRGIRVDRRMRTSVPHIYAAGDCCEAEEIVSGEHLVVNLWANAGMQGRVAARNIAGYGDEFQGNFTHNITHFLDIDFIGIGDNRIEGERIAYESPDGWTFEMILQNGTPRCVNILENHLLSGPAKAALIKRLTAPECSLGFDTVSALAQAGLPEEIIRKIKGERYDDT